MTRGVCPIKVSNTCDSSSCGERVEARLRICGEDVCISAQIDGHRGRLSDILPVARAAADAVGEVVNREVQRSGEKVTCRKGCSGCCSYLVPLSVPGVFRLREEVFAMEAGQRESALRWSATAGQAILERLPDDGVSESLSEANSETVGRAISQWYAEFGLVCPFLKQDVCTCYDLRPIACREHLVTSPAAWCAGGAEADPEVAVMPVSVLEVLADWAAEMEGMEMESIMLPFALAWAEDNIERRERTWPARDMVERFLGMLVTASELKVEPQAARV